MTHEENIRKLGLEIVRASFVVGSKYTALCLYIRKNNVSHRLVLRVMRRAGFTRQRIHEVLRVSYAPSRVFNLFETAFIGFNRCVQLVRHEKRVGYKATEAGRLLVRKGWMSAKQLKEEVSHEQLVSDEHTERRRWLREHPETIKDVAKRLAGRAEKDLYHFTFIDLGVEVIVRRLHFHQ